MYTECGTHSYFFFTMSLSLHLPHSLKCFSFLYILTLLKHMLTLTQDAGKMGSIELYNRESQYYTAIQPHCVELIAN